MVFGDSRSRRKKKLADLERRLQRLLPKEERLKEDVNHSLISNQEFEESYLPVAAKIYEVYRQMLAIRQEQREEAVKDSLAQLKKLKHHVAQRSTDADTPKEELARIKNLISSLDLDIADIKAEMEARRPPRKVKAGEEVKTALPNLLVVIPIILVVAALALAVDYYGGLCPEVGISSKMFRIIDLLAFISERSPQDHAMLCRYVGSVDYTMGTASETDADGDIRLAADGVLSPSATDAEEIFKTSVIVHEACHLMMREVMGGFGGLAEEEVERPCVRMQYQYLYRAGLYGDTDKSYARMVEDLATGTYAEQIDSHTESTSAVLKRYGGDSPSTSEAPVAGYCNETGLNVSVVPRENREDLFDLELANTGSSTIHCGFVECRVDGREYPLGCDELAPGDSYTTGNSFTLATNQTIEVGIVGCENTTKTIRGGQVAVFPTVF